MEETVVTESSTKPVKRKRVTRKKMATAVKAEDDAEAGSSSDLSEMDTAGTNTGVKPVSLDGSGNFMNIQSRQSADSDSSRSPQSATALSDGSDTEKPMATTGSKRVSLDSRTHSQRSRKRKVILIPVPCPSSPIISVYTEPRPHHVLLDHGFPTQKRKHIDQDPNADVKPEEIPGDSHKKQRKGPAKRGRDDGDAKDAGAPAPRRKGTVTKTEGSSDSSSLSSEQ